MNSKTITRLGCILLAVMMLAPQTYSKKTSNSLNYSDNSIIKKIGCAVCLGVKAHVIQLAQWVDVDQDKILNLACPIISAFSKDLPTDRCIAVAKLYEPYAIHSLLKILVTKQDLLCGLILKQCSSPDISFFDLKKYLSDMRKDTPSKSTKPKPTGAKGYYTVLQVNDIHLDQKYITGGIVNCDNGIICCRESSVCPFAAKPEYSGKYGYQGTCDIPPATFEAFLTFASQKIKPDYVMWLGDNEAHEIDQVSPKYNIQTANTLVDGFKKAFPDTPFWISIGNHESYPVDNFDETSGKDQWLLDGLSEAFTPLLKDEKVVAQVKKTGYYAQQFPERNLKIISIFGGDYDAFNFNNLFRTFDPLGQLRWLSKELNKSETSNEHVFIMTHIPIGESTVVAPWNDAFNAILERYQNTVTCLFSGHTHHDHMKLHTRHNQRDQVYLWDLIGPSLTTYSKMNPSFRVYKVDVETNQVVDFDQYRLDLDKWNANPPTPPQIVEWDKVYSFVEEYGLKDMTAESMQAFRDKIVSHEDLAFLKKYTNNFLTEPQTFEPTERKQLERICDLLDNSKDLYECMKKMKLSPGKSSLLAILMDFNTQFN